LVEVGRFLGTFFRERAGGRLEGGLDGVVQAQGRGDGGRLVELAGLGPGGGGGGLLPGRGLERVLRQLVQAEVAGPPHRLVQPPRLLDLAGDERGQEAAGGGVAADDRAHAGLVEDAVEELAGGGRVLVGRAGRRQEQRFRLALGPRGRRRRVGRDAEG